jgi:hypothetical protein
MAFLAFVGIITIVYFLVRLILWTLLDSDIELFIYEKLGKPIGDYYLLYYKIYELKKKKFT